MEILELPTSKRCGKTVLDENMDEKLQAYLRTLRNLNGAIVNSAIVKATARGLVRASDKKLLAEFGGHVTLTKAWSHSLLSRMGWIKRRGSSTEKNHIPEDVFQKPENEYLESIRAMLRRILSHLNSLSSGITQGFTSPLWEDGLWSWKV